MNIFRCSVLIALICANSFLYSQEDASDSMTCLDTIPTRGVVSHVTEYAREHMWCMLAVGACIGYIYVNSLLESMKPNPYEGPLREAHEHIAELEAAIMKYEQVYRVLKPVLKYATSE